MRRARKRGPEKGPEKGTEKGRQPLRVVLSGVRHSGARPVGSGADSLIPLVEAPSPRMLHEDASAASRPRHACVHFAPAIALQSPAPARRRNVQPFALLVDHANPCEMHQL